MLGKIYLISDEVLRLPGHHCLGGSSCILPLCFTNHKIMVLIQSQAKMCYSDSFTPRQASCKENLMRNLPLLFSTWAGQMAFPKRDS